MKGCGIMPNWCNNFITFWSDGTPEGDVGLKDLNNKIGQTFSLVRDWGKMKLFERIPNCYAWYNAWECYLAEYMYGIHIDCYQRGYITFCEDLEPGRDHFNVECDDAWSPNIGFWQTLLNYAYCGHITFTYQASEPGMEIYQTNDSGLLPRYSAYIYASGIDRMREFDKIWDDSYSKTFQCLIPAEGVYNGKYGVALEVDLLEGDEDEILMNIDEYKTLSDDTTIDTLENDYSSPEAFRDTTHVFPWELVDIEECVHDEEATNTFISKFSNTKKPDFEEYGRVRPVTSNFVHYVGGNNNE